MFYKNIKVAIVGCGSISGIYVVTAIIQYQNGILGTLHMNSDCIKNEENRLKIYGTEGILTTGASNQFGATVYLQKPLNKSVVFSFAHGYKANSCGSVHRKWLGLLRRSGITVPVRKWCTMYLKPCTAICRVPKPANPTVMDRGH